MLEARGLAIGYGGRTVAAGIDFGVGRGDVVCLLGPNGVGKTTLFRTLLGLQPALGGDAVLSGQPIAGLSRAQIARAIAYVPQAQTMAFAYSVLDLVLMGRTAHLGPFATPASRDHERAREALSALGILDLADRDASRISGGQRQLCLIARAMAQDAPVMLMDEPAASLDLGNRLLVVDRVRALRARGYGLVMSTHDPGQAFEVATHVGVMAHGRLVAYGPPASTLTASLLTSAYGVRVDIETIPGGRQVVVAGGSFV